ncbi:hypothetical protein GGS23DRAFT_545053 [Durotheca rogersii]|uniref:uncharacterized protein n=1 Tax=Durotheca rogersii TaxID=419775 RepID=UPI00221E4228|nr:uncharacterized protein GGS23DRAFT_545053 [Durotheca rogersii]KAI5868354.1 hypothetical protein GGS23DRAFT_545053 [Durotheca rogersii]
MARLFAVLLAAVATFQVGSAAPHYPYPNGTVPAIPAPTTTGFASNLVPHEAPKRRLREFPISLVRP